MTKIDQDFHYSFAMAAPYNLERAYQGDPEIDLIAMSAKAVGSNEIVQTDSMITVKPGQTVLIDTEASITRMDANKFGMVALRSGTGKLGLVMMNAPGIIGSKYRGNIMVMVTNVTRYDSYVKIGQRFAHMVIMEHHSHRVPVKSTEERGIGGFGSSGN